MARDAVSLDVWRLTSQRILLLSPSESSSQRTALLFNCLNMQNNTPRSFGKVGSCTHSITFVHLRRLPSSAAPLWYPEISLFNISLNMFFVSVMLWSFMRRRTINCPDYRKKKNLLRNVQLGRIERTLSCELNICGSVHHA